MSVAQKPDNRADVAPSALTFDVSTAIELGQRGLAGGSGGGDGAFCVLQHCACTEVKAWQGFVTVAELGIWVGGGRGVLAGEFS